MIRSAAGEALDPTAPRLRLVRSLGILVALAVAAVLPLGYFVIGYTAEVASHQAKAEIKAELINQLVSATPDLWQFQELRLRELLVRYPAGVDEDRALIVDAGGTVVVDTMTPLAWPVLRQAAPLFDADRPVGQIELRHSIRDLLTGTAVAGMLGLLLASTVFALVRFLTERERRMVEARFEEQERARVTLHSIGDAVITTDGGGRIDYINPIAERLTGWPRIDAIGQALDDVMQLIDETTLETVPSPMAQALRDNEARALTTHSALVRRDGTTIAVDDSAAPIHDRHGAIVGGVLVFRDVTVARSMAQRISWAATHDALTGLVNRREFEDRVDIALTSARNSARHHVLCYLDLDQFKVVNDTAGHAAGDALLKQLAHVLQDRLRDSDTLARLGGDEFGVLLDSCPLDRAQFIAADLLAAVKSTHFSWQDKTFVVGVSIGLVAIKSDSVSRGEIFSAADAACYAAKEQGRNRVCVSHQGDADLIERRRTMDWAAKLGRALHEDRFVLYYQSYRALAPGDKSATHIEILLRLIDEDGSLVLPGSFIPAAERYGIMPAIDQWVVKTAFASYPVLAARLGAPLICCINLSGTSLNDEGLVEFIREQSRLHGIAKGTICFEITETAAINNLRRATDFVKAIKALGFSFALDDFGSGSSSFGYLKNLPVDYLKIDGGFVQDIAVDPLDRAMTETINRVGHIMGLKTIAEFAESEAVIDELRSIGVDFAQGYGVDQPRPVIQEIAVASVEAIAQAKVHSTP